MGGFFCLHRSGGMDGLGRWFGLRGGCKGCAEERSHNEGRNGEIRTHRQSPWSVITISHQITSYPSCRNNLICRVNQRTIMSGNETAHLGAITRPRDVGKICRLQSRHAIGFVPAKQPLLISLLEQVSRFCAPPAAAWCGHSVRSGPAPPTAAGPLGLSSNLVPACAHRSMATWVSG